MKRRGLAKGQGKGYKNVIPKDPKVHSQSAQGQKQPQKPSVLQRTGRAFASAGSKAKQYAKGEYEKYKEAQKKKKFEALKDIQHPKVKRLNKQEKHVDELEKSLSQTTDPERREKLKDRIENERRELHNLHEEVTDIKMADLTNNELREIAIRHKENEGMLSGIFGSGENKYEQELLRRIRRQKEVDAKVREEKQKPVKKEKSLFDDLF